VERVKRKPVEVYPGITVSRDIRFGEPVLAGTRIDAAIIVDRFLGGESMSDLTSDYFHPYHYAGGMYLIAQALRWGCLSRDVRARRVRKALAR
jgi:hypothetical protein